MRPEWNYASAMPGVAWPAVPAFDQTYALALLFQLERSQWLPGPALQRNAAAQLDALLGFAYDTVPFYRRKWGRRPASTDLSGLPLLARTDLQAHSGDLFSHDPPRGHGAMHEVRTSGSVGAPVTVLKSALQGILWRALTLRDHRWHRRAMDRTLAVIRRGAGSGTAANWGSATEGVVATGPLVVKDVNHDADELLDWLKPHRPGYLLTYPSLAAELARRSLQRGEGLPGLLQIRTLGEALDGEARALCREAWGVPVVDAYSSEELGYMALQCPEREHYHVQAESVVLEVLDERGSPCRPGETGKVVVTDLHNFAMPLVRYDIGDFAELGEPCACGRGLPVLKRIAGRVRNMLVTPRGGRFWPSSGLRKQTDVPKLRQYQFVQTAPDLLEARMVVSQPLTAKEEEYLVGRIRSRLPEGIRVAVRYVEAIPRSAGGKYEEFVCEVPRA